MEEPGNKTIICSVFFLDIVEYSKKSVTGQISLKDRFNSYLTTAIRDIPITDRIILDTGDGAAITFLGDIEDALKAALDLRENLLKEDSDIELPLLVRMGINLGPVRLVRDINGQPNIVGDGINVAQRVMGFADASQILVSRSYYDAVSRLSPQYAGMFHYQGSRTDKHVREHEVYAIGYPGDKTTQWRMAGLAQGEHSESVMAGALASAIAYSKMIWRVAKTQFNALIGRMSTRFQQAELKQRVVYVAVAVVPLLIIVILVGHELLEEDHGIPAMPVGDESLAISAVLPSSAVAPTSAVLASTDLMQGGPTQSQASSKLDMKLMDGRKQTKNILKAKPKTKRNEASAKTKTQSTITNKSDVAASRGDTAAYLSVHCLDGTEVFLDGIRKGRIKGTLLSIKATPGAHTVIVSHPRGVDSRNVVLEAGSTVRISPGFCN